MAARADLNVISLCAGGGGLDLGLRLALPRARTVCYVEREVTEAAVLAKGIEAGLLDDAPIWSDLLSFDAGAWRGRVHGVVGGFPCQPHSFAGKRLGEADERNLWPAIARVVCDVAPEFCFFENVPGIAAFYWRTIRPDLQALGYEVAEGIFSAEEVGAPHLRERLFILAVTEGQQQHLHTGWRREGQGEAFPPGPSDADAWRRWLDAWPGTEPALRRDADGLAFRADRLRVLGNGVVPVVAAKAFRELRGRF